MNTITQLISRNHRLYTVGYGAKPQDVADLFIAIQNYRTYVGVDISVVVNPDGVGFLVLDNTPVFDFTHPVEATAYLVTHIEGHRVVVADSLPEPQVELDPGQVEWDEYGTAPGPCPGGEPANWWDRLTGNVTNNPCEEE